MQPSLLWSTVQNKWLVAGGKDNANTGRTNPDRRLFDCSEVVFALSDDLVHWSEPYSIYRPECAENKAGIIYPSVRRVAISRFGFRIEHEHSVIAMPFETNYAENDRVRNS